MERVSLHKLKTQTRAFDRTDRSDTHVVTARRLDQDDAALDGHIAHARGEDIWRRDHLPPGTSKHVYSIFDGYYVCNIYTPGITRLPYTISPTQLRIGSAVGESRSCCVARRTETLALPRHPDVAQVR